MNRRERVVFILLLLLLLVLQPNSPEYPPLYPQRKENQYLLWFLNHYVLSFSISIVNDCHCCRGWRSNPDRYPKCFSLPTKSQRECPWSWGSWRERLLPMVETLRFCRYRKYLCLWLFWSSFIHSLLGMMLESLTCLISPLPGYLYIQYWSLFLLPKTKCQFQSKILLCWSPVRYIRRMWCKWEFMDSIWVVISSFFISLFRVHIGISSFLFVFCSFDWQMKARGYPVLRFHWWNKNRGNRWFAQIQLENTG